MVEPTKRLHAQHVSLYVDIEEQVPGTVAIAAGAAQSAALEEGLYDVHVNQNCYVKVAPIANDVTAGTGYLQLANTVVTYLVRNQSKIGVIRDGADGTLRYHKVG